MEAAIRAARIGDAGPLRDIYAYYVENTALTFEYEVPSLEEFQNRMAHTLARYPYLVAESEDGIVGYSYAGRFHPRAAYAWNAETTVYLKPGSRRQGVGRMLYTRMEEILREQGIVKTIAIITLPVDAYSDFNSMQFHEKMGYGHAGRMDFSGFKFGRWYSTICMDKIISAPKENMEPVRAFDDVRKKFGL